MLFDLFPESHVVISSTHSSLVAFNSQRWKRTLSTEELSRDVESLTSHNNDLLAVEELLSHGTGQATKEMTLAINGDLYSPSANHSSNSIIVAIRSRIFVDIR